MKGKGWSPFDKARGLSKNQLLIGGLAGLLLLVVAIPAEQGRKQEPKQETRAEEGGAAAGADSSSSSYRKELERKLVEILGEMDGVGKVEVMITTQDSGERIVEKDITRSSQEVSEEDGTLKRGTRESQYQEGTVFSQENGAAGEPFVSKEVVPRVEGVLVVAEGGGNAKVVKNISDAVLALFPVEVHKIKVVKMN